MITLKKTHYIIIGCFFFSVMASLIYQVLWVRQFGLVFGNTLHSVSTVLAIFMAGLALGSYLFGRIADRTSNPLRLFALLEIGIGLYVLALPQNIIPLCIIPIGYPNEEKPPENRYQPSQIHYNG